MNNLEKQFLSILIALLVGTLLETKEVGVLVAMYSAWLAYKYYRKP